MPSDPLILRVAVPSPLRRLFDYLPPASCPASSLVPGVRVRVPFGRTTAIGVVVEIAANSEVPPQRLKSALEVLDAEALLPADLLALMRWSQDYYHHPPGEVLLAALPTLLRKGHAARASGIKRWYLTGDGSAVDPAGLARAPRQAVLLARLAAAGAQGLGPEQLSEIQDNWHAPLAKLVDKGWAEMREAPCLADPPARQDAPAPELNEAQQAAVTTVLTGRDGFGAFLLDGVTGSGKTEVYLRLIDEVVRAGRQALVLVPEIGLTPQLVARFRARLACPIAVLHSDLGDQERLCAWLAARDGRAAVIIGTRSAVFTPMRRPGLIVVDEEHDVSFKQQDGFRYSARDVAVMRARRAGIPIVLGTATPSLETLHNADQGRYHALRLPTRAGAATPPAVRLLDVRREDMEEGLSAPLLATMQRHLDRQGQVLLFLNRRGFAPVLICHECGWVGKCHRCDAHLTLYQRERRLRCHHCGTERPVDPHCSDCGSVDLRGIGWGTQRLEAVLQQRFPTLPVVRIDRDSTRRKGAMQALLDEVMGGEPRILIGTQMLAKGHHFPNVTLVGIIDADQGLHSADFRGAERMAQQVVQVAGRAGRAERPGEVLIQTHHPDHPLLQRLIRDGYGAFAKAALAERREALLPPFSFLALLRAEALQPEPAHTFLREAADLARGYAPPGVDLLGPVPAPMERRAGRYRAQLLVQAEQRAALHQLLQRWAGELEGLKTGRKVRWSLDVDPVEMF